MKYFLPGLTFLLVIWIVFAMNTPADKAELKQRLEIKPLLVHSSNANGQPITHRFEVEVAVTAEEKSKGLMFRTEMAENAGMIFLNAPPRVMTMWMRNTDLALDMLFVDTEWKIFQIVHNAEPQSLSLISSQGEALAVIELNAGIANKLGIHEGDKVELQGIAGAY